MRPPRQPPPGARCTPHYRPARPRRDATRPATYKVSKHSPHLHKDRLTPTDGPVGATWTSTGVKRCRETVWWAASFWRVPCFLLWLPTGVALAV
eukprot:4292668-Prymnesium_polylepis.1